MSSKDNFGKATKACRGKSVWYLGESVVEQSEAEQKNEEPYHVKCQNRYRESRVKYDKFFLKCVEEIEDLQPSAFACVQISRYFTVGILPGHCRIPDPLTPKERERVERILKN